MIEVHVASWQQECCGDPFGVGDRVEWMLGAVTDDDGVHYVEDHHSEESLAAVAGRVMGIRRVRFHYEAMPGQRPFHVAVGPAEIERVDAVAGAGGDHADGYEVDFDPEPFATLPSPRAPWIDEDERAAEDEQRRAASSPVGTALTLLVDGVSARHGGSVMIARSPTRAGITITPRSTGAADVLWTLWIDRIDVIIGESEWTLPADESGVERLRAMIAAAAEGRVERRIVERNTVEVDLLGSGERPYRRVTQGLGELSPGRGIVFMPSRDFDALQRGTERSTPWSDPPGRGDG